MTIQSKTPRERTQQNGNIKIRFENWVEFVGKAFLCQATVNCIQLRKKFTNKKLLKQKKCFSSNTVCSPYPKPDFQQQASECTSFSSFSQISNQNSSILLALNSTRVGAPKVGLEKPLRFLSTAGHCSSVPSST